MAQNMIQPKQLDPTVRVRSDLMFSAKDFGVLGSSPTTDLATINAAIAGVSIGTVVIPAGTYSFSGDVLISSKNNGTGSTGYFTLDATGVKMTGTGRIIIDSCKRIKIIGMDAPSYDLTLRGCWTSTFENMRFRKVIMGDATGASYSSAAWLQFIGGTSQGAVIHANATSYYNIISWRGHQILGYASQGFTATQDYAFEFLGNVGAQNWVFEQGDVSYQNVANYLIGPLNTVGGIELTYRDTYFDSFTYPVLSSVVGTKIRMEGCHHTNAHNFSTTIDQALAGGQVDMHRSDKSIKHNGSMNINLVKNGDFKDILSTWVGTDAPISAFSGGTVTPKSGGLSGTYLTVSALAGSSICYFTSIPVPLPSRLTGTILLRNADAGSRTINLGIMGQYTAQTISDANWTVVTSTNNTLQSVGASANILLYAADGSAYNVDVAYVGMTMGNGGNITSEDPGHRFLFHSFTWNPGTQAAAAVLQNTITLANTQVGDFVEVTANQALGTVRASGHVDVAGQVVVTIQNIGASNVGLTSSTWYVKVHKRTY